MSDFVVRKNDVVIAGAGNLGRFVLDCLAGDERWRCIGFLDEAKAGQTKYGLPVYAPDAYDVSLTRNALLAVGYPQDKRRMLAAADGLGLDWQTFIDRRSLVGPEARIGRGSLVMNFATVASGAELGEFNLVNSYAHVSGQARSGHRSSAMPGAGLGRATIGTDCVLGFKSFCSDGAQLGDRVAVAPLTIIRRHVGDDALVVGNPGRIFRRTPVSIRL